MDSLYSTILLCILSAILLHPQKCFADDLSPVVEITTGKIVGVVKESRDDRDFFAYRGIPYARPPIGELRFEPPVSPDNWTDVKEVDEYAKGCIQYDPFEKKVVGKEDCLYINVFTPKTGDGISKKLLPVMVFIHGEYFMTGSSNTYRPHYFMDEDVVIVTFNYRLASFGFLNTEDGIARGNQGLKDQVMALKWVQQNIRKFGGDPNRVTLFGSGGGAESVHLHMLSPMSKGLFRKAITQSGSAFKPLALQMRPREAALRLGRHFAPQCKELLNAALNLTLKSDEECNIVTNTSLLLQCLKLIDAKKLSEYHKEFNRLPPNPLSFFTPSLEENFNYGNDTAFLTEHPFSIINSGRQIKVPWMTGLNSEEGLSYTSKISNVKELTEQVENHFDQVAPDYLVYNKFRTDITKGIRRFYLTEPKPVQEDPSLNSTDPLFDNFTLPVLPPVRNSPLTPILISAATTTTSTTTTTTTTAPTTTIAYDYIEDDNVFSFEEKFVNITNAVSDRYFTVPMSNAVRIQTKYSPVWLYYYTYKGQYSLSDAYAGKAKADQPGLALRQLGRVKSWFKKKVLGKVEPVPKHLGACHGDETILLFKYPELKIKENTKDYEMSKDLVKLWVHFAYNEKFLKFRNVTWHPINPGSENFRVMSFGNSENSTGIIEEPYSKRVEFWNSLKYFAPFQQL